MSACFPKSEHLCGKLRIASFYKTGHRFVSYPLRVTWQRGAAASQAASVQVLVWAPKSLFKHAVNRNMMRRLMREAYRLEKEPLITKCKERQVALEMAFNYMSKDEKDITVIRKAVRKAIEKIISALDSDI